MTQANTLRSNTSHDPANVSRAAAGHENTMGKRKGKAKAKGKGKEKETAGADTTVTQRAGTLEYKKKVEVGLRTFCSTTSCRRLAADAYFENPPTETPRK